MNSNGLKKKYNKIQVGLSVYFILIFTLPFQNVFSWATTNPYVCRHTLSSHCKQAGFTRLCLLWVSSAYHRVVSSGHICSSYLHLPKPSNFSICGVLVREQEKGRAEAILLIIKCVHKYLLTTHSVINTVTLMISLAARFVHPRGICKCFWKKLKWLYFAVLRTSPGTSWMVARGTGWGTFLDNKISFGADAGSISLKNRIAITSVPLPLSVLAWIQPSAPVSFHSLFRPSLFTYHSWYKSCHPPSLL